MDQTWGRSRNPCSARRSLQQCHVSRSSAIHSVSLTHFIISFSGIPTEDAIWTAVLAFCGKTKFTRSDKRICSALNRHVYGTWLPFIPIASHFIICASVLDFADVNTWRLNLWWFVLNYKNLEVKIWNPIRYESKYDFHVFQHIAFVLNVI